MTSEWTSVKEQLPKNGTKVLCLYDGAKTRIFDATYSARSGWTNHDDISTTHRRWHPQLLIGYSNTLHHEDVDYWQPLPKLPATFQVGK